MALFGRDKSQPWSPGQNIGRSENSSVSGATSIEPNDADIDQEWEASVAKIEKMTSAELFRDAAGEVVNGDEEDDDMVAGVYFARAAAVGNLAIYRLMEESGHHPPAPM